MWARIEGDRVVEITDIDPTGRYHPSLVWVRVSDSSVQVGWGYVDGAFIAPQSQGISAQSLKDAVTQKRWEVETGGITMSDGRKYDTSRESQTLTRAALQDAQELMRDSVSFFTLGNWYVLTTADLLAVCAAISNHRQDCRDAERAHHEAIDALVAQHEGDAQGLQEALEAYDVEQGWPASDLREPDPA